MVDEQFFYKINKKSYFKGKPLKAQTLEGATNY